MDTFDYKPTLVKLHDTPMPSSEGLVTFQGASDHLIRPIWEFKPRGQSGKRGSGLLPNLACGVNEWVRPDRSRLLAFVDPFLRWGDPATDQRLTDDASGASGPGSGGRQILIHLDEMAKGWLNIHAESQPTASTRLPHLLNDALCRRSIPG